MVQRALELDGTDIFSTGNISVVRGLPDWLGEAQLRQDFGDCGPLRRASMPMDGEGKGKGFAPRPKRPLLSESAYVQYKSDEAMKKALEWHQTWYKGVQITVEKLGEETKGRGRGRGRREKKEKLPDGPTVRVTGLSDHAAWRRGGHQHPFEAPIWQATRKNEGEKQDPQMLKQAFEPCGEVVACKVLVSGKGRSKGKPRGTGLVVFATEEAQQKAVATMDEAEAEEATRMKWAKLDFSALEGEGDKTLLEEEDDDDWENFDWDDEDEDDDEEAWFHW
ncbi:unnamed protein product [Effrenium voratum]|nr:unnamed protein product [Effrenium voratum]